MTTILLTLDPQDLSEAQSARIRALTSDSRLIITDNKEELQALLDEAEIIAGWVPQEWISRAPKLRWYQQWGAGTDWLMRHPEVASRDFILTNASGVHAVPITEHIFAFLLAFARHLPQAIRAQERRVWDRVADDTTVELYGKTMVLVGVGAIGRQTALVASAMGMRVIGVRSDPSKDAPGIDRMVGPDELESVLPEADFVVLTIPHTRKTHKLFNARLFGLMKSSAYLVNIGRGGTVDEAALVEALRSGQIAGAGLDVFEVEPLPSESPLWEMENVIVTGHYSGNTPRYHERALEIFINNLERYQNGQPMVNLVDKQRGY